MSTIPVIIEEDGRSARRGTEEGALRGATLGGSSGSRGFFSGIMDMDTDKLGGSMSKISSGLAEILQHVSKVDGFRLKEAEVQLAVNAEGGFALVGKAGVRGAVTLKFAVEND